MSIDLDLSEVSTSKIITATIEGILEPDDLAALASGELDVTEEETDAEVGSITAGLEKSDDPANLKKLRERHHSVARLVASGLSQRMVAAMAGYTESYVSILLRNPAMEELVELYRLQYGSAAQIIGEKLRSVALKSVEEMDERLSSPKKREELSFNDLAAAAKLGLDRSGHGPTSTQHVVNEDHVFDHAKIAELSANARAASTPYIVPVREVRRALPAPKDEEQGS